MKKKKLVIYNNSIIMDGQATVLMNILKNLDSSKYDISLLIMDDHGADNVLLPQVPLNIKLYFCRPPSSVKKYHYYKNIKRNIFQKIYYNYLLMKLKSVGVSQCIKHLEEIQKNEGKIDVFIDFDGSTMKFIDKINVKQKILWRHHSFSEIPARKLSVYFNNVTKFDKIVTICDDMQKVVLENKPQLAKMTYVAYNPINLERIVTLANDISDLSEKNKEILDKDYIVTVANINIAHKDYRTLIKAYKIAKSRGFNWKLYAIGDGQDWDKLVEIIKENDLADDVIMLGLQKNPYVIMKNAKFFVLSSKNEGLPTVVIEAITLGLPVVSSDCPVGPREILQNGESGILVPVEDAEAMANKFMELYNNSELREKYSTAGFVRSQDFSIEKTMKVIEQIIDA